MALITCPECGKEISDKAETCIHCGFPLGEIIKDGGERMNETSTQEPKKSEFDNLSGDECIINGETYSKQSIKNLIKEDKIWKYLLKERKIPSDIAFRFMEVVRFYNDEIPTDYRIGFEELREFNRKKVEEMNKFKPKIHCKYCGSDNVRKLGPFEKLAVQCIGKEWHCKKCNSDF